MNYKETVEKIENILSGRTRKREYSKGGRIPSAVILLLYYRGGEFYVLVTKRSLEVNSHKGEISFPGGGYDSLLDKDLKECVLREVYEEIGVKPSDIEILGMLDDIKTQNSYYVISPFVGVMPYPYDFKIKYAEVERIISVPLCKFFEESRYKEQKVYGKDFVHFYYKDIVIWGATGIILNQFLLEVFDFTNHANH